MYGKNSSSALLETWIQKWSLTSFHRLRSVKLKVQFSLVGVWEIMFVFHSELQLCLYWTRQRSNNKALKISIQFDDVSLAITYLWCWRKKCSGTKCPWQHCTQWSHASRQAGFEPRCSNNRSSVNVSLYLNSQ